MLYIYLCMDAIYILLHAHKENFHVSQPIVAISLNVNLISQNNDTRHILILLYTCILYFHPFRSYHQWRNISF